MQKRLIDTVWIFLRAFIVNPSITCFSVCASESFCVACFCILFVTVPFWNQALAIESSLQWSLPIPSLPL